MQKYYKVISLIEQFQEETQNVVKMFKENVLDKKYTAQGADIILSTIHAAKGMEWDRVQVLDGSMMRLSKFTNVYAKPSRSMAFQSASATYQLRAIFDYVPYGDELHLWYVALSRAKSALHLPGRFMELLRDFEEVSVLSRVKTLST